MLSAGSLGARLAVLQSIILEPTRALQLGPHEGEDFVDLLIRLIPDASGVLKQTLTLCLMSYQDPRTGDFLAQAFATSRDAATVLHLGQRLLLDRGPEFFLPFLWSEKGAQALAAARICQDLPELSPRERLRIALLLPEGLPPELTEATRADWLAELNGPHRARAAHLAQRSEQALLLWDDWERLEDPAWLLELTERLDPGRARREVEKRLPGLARHAHRHKLTLPRECLDHADPEIRALAIRDGWADDSLPRYLEATLPEALAATRRCPLHRLVELLQDDRWQVRAEAVRTLADVEPRPLAEVRALVGREGDLGPRAAAVDLLQRWSDDDWLEENLITDG